MSASIELIIWKRKLSKSVQRQDPKPRYLRREPKQWKKWYLDIEAFLGRQHERRIKERR